MSIGYRMKKYILWVAVLVGSYSCSKTEMPDATHLPINIIEASSEVRVEIGNYVGYDTIKRVHLLPNTKIYVTAITDSTRVCINDYCYKLNAGEWAMACSGTTDFKN